MKFIQIFNLLRDSMGNRVKKVKDYEVVIEELVAENSRLVLEICNKKISLMILIKLIFF